MAELIASGPLDGHSPVEAAGCRLEALAPGPLAMVMPWPGAKPDLRAALGVAMPAPGEVLAAEGFRLAWAGRSQALLIGAKAPAIPGAAVVELTDGWGGLRLSGDTAEAVLARLVPIDLRAAAFPEGRAARTLAGHVQVLILRQGGGFEILAMSSFLRTLWDEIAHAMHALAARTAAGI